MFRKMSFLFILILVHSCAKNPTSLEDFTKTPVAYSKNKIEAPNKDFSIVIPTGWSHNFITQSNGKILLDFKATSQTYKNGFHDQISIQKMKSFNDSKDLQSEIKYITNILKNHFDSNIIESGEIKILDYKGYYFITEITKGEFGKATAISFVLEATEKEVFYNLIGIVSKTNEFDDNMAIVIDCLKLFRIKN